MRKFFNVIVRIRGHRHGEMLHYVHALNEEYHLNLNNNTLSLVAKEYAKNPRRVVQLINNLTLEQSLFDDGFAQKNETLIAALLIIREEYPLMIDEILKNRTIVAIDFVHSGENESVLPNKLKEDTEFLSFMRMARQTFVNAEPEDLMRIITNTHQALNNLTEDLIKSIISFDSKAVLEYVKLRGETRCDVLAFIEERLKEDDEFDAEDDILNYIDLIAEVNAVVELTETE